MHICIVKKSGFIHGGSVRLLSKRDVDLESTESIKQKLKRDVSTEKFFPLIMAGIAFHLSGWTSS